MTQAWDAVRAMLAGGTSTVMLHNAYPMEDENACQRKTEKMPEKKGVPPLIGGTDRQRGDSNFHFSAPLSDNYF